MSSSDHDDCCGAGVDRRGFLRSCPPVVLALLARGWFPPVSAAPETGSADGIVDEALDILGRYGPEYGGGLSNHAPMAVEAIVQMGRPEAVLPWIERYKGRLAGPPGKVARVTDENWREALGEVRRVADWIEYFDAQLAASDWKAVLERWLSRLAPGLVGAAAHCVIRTGHAVRQLEAVETPQRRHELAQGLGYWAARYVTLPGVPSGTGTLGPASAIERVPLLPEELRRRGVPIVDAMQGLHELPGWEGVIDMVDAGKPDFLSELTASFADVYLHNAGNGRIAFVHAVTGPSALRILSPYAEAGARSPAARYAWQAAAGIYATFARERFRPTERRTEVKPAELIDRAIHNASAHAIKFTEVCLREWKVNPRPNYLAAALDSTEHLSPLT